MASERSGPVAGVVLAAGASTRMGENKLLLQLDGETLLRRVVRRTLAAGLDPVIVVLGHEAQRAEPELSGLASRAILNPDHARGQHTSFRTGIAAVPEEAPAAVILLADMPYVTEKMISALVSRYRETTAPLVISEYGGVHAPPTLYDRSLFSEIREMTGDGCGRQVVRRHRGAAEAVAWPADRLADLDSPEDVRGSGLHFSGFRPSPVLESKATLKSEE
jgi:molybdenum cofactor cytidylyltransferase